MIWRVQERRIKGCEKNISPDASAEVLVRRDLLACDATAGVNERLGLTVDALSDSAESDDVDEEGEVSTAAEARGAGLMRLPAALLLRVACSLLPLALPADSVREIALEEERSAAEVVDSVRAATVDEDRSGAAARSSTSSGGSCMPCVASSSRMATRSASTRSTGSQYVSSELRQFGSAPCDTFTQSNNTTPYWR